MTDPRHAQAREMRDRGMLLREIAAHFGVAESTVLRWMDPAQAESDRAASRARKERYRGVCVDCGAATSYDSDMVACERCRGCRHRFATENARWRPDRMIAAAHEWEQFFGRQPGATDWNGSPAALARNPSAAARIAQAREHGLAWPYSSDVQRRFGSWSAFIAACGFEPLPVGRPRRERVAA